MSCVSCYDIVFLNIAALSSEFLNASAFSVGINELDNLQTRGTVICGFLTNGLVDSYTGEGDVQAILSTTIGIYCNAIKTAQDRTNCKMVVMVPFARPKPDWLSKQHDFISKSVTKQLGLQINIELVTSLTIPDQLFEKDGIHLNDLGLSMLHAHLMSSCSAFRRTLNSVSRPSVSDEIDVFADSNASQTTRKRQGSPTANVPTKTHRRHDENMSVDSATTEEDGITVTLNKQESSSQHIVDVVRNTISEEMSKFIKAQTETNVKVSNRLKEYDSEILVLHESTDEAINMANRHILLVSGLKGSLPKDRRDKNKMAHQSTIDFLNKIGSGKVDLMFATFIPGPPPRPGCLPMLKMSFGSHGDAFHVKKKFDEFRKANQRICQDIYLSPELTRATRVRAAILAAMVKKRKVQDYVKGARPQVNKFDSKPDISFRDSKTGKIEKRISFKEALDRFLPMLAEDDLIIVRRIAGKAFAKRIGFLFNLTEPS